MSFGPLIGAEALAASLDDPDLCVVDCRHDLADLDAGRRAFAQAHIPGAVFMHLDEDLSGPCNGHNGRHPLPTPEEFARRIGALGISRSTRVVAYDDAGGAIAARLWWMLRWIGHEHVAVLDGSYRSWIQTGMAVTQETRKPTPVNYTPTVAVDSTIDADTLARALRENVAALIDARSPDRFRGENETLDPVAGHIPGAMNRFFRDNLANGHFRESSELRAQFEAMLDGRPPADVVHQCGSGVTACHNLLAMEIAGLTGSRLYPGSWSEWCADPARPVATGDA